jgi:hypothetical protein
MKKELVRSGKETIEGDDREERSENGLSGGCLGLRGGEWIVTVCEDRIAGCRKIGSAGAPIVDVR